MSQANVPPTASSHLRHALLSGEWLKTFFANLSRCPTTLSVLTVGSLLVMVGCVVGSLALLIWVGVMGSHEGRTNPLNIESFDYNVSKYVAMRSPPPYFLLILCVLPLAIWVFAGVITLIVWKDKGLLFSCFPVLMVMGLVTLYAILAFLGSVPTCVSLYKQLRPSYKRIKTFNQYVHTRVYKGNAQFLRMLQIVPTDRYTMMSQIESALKELPPAPKMDTSTIAKAFFSINLYLHFQEIGYNNAYLPDALRTLHPAKMLVLQSYTPSDYLFRKYTHIKDNSATARDMLRKIWEQKTNGNLSPDSVEMLDTAQSTTAEWSSEASNLANVFTPDESFRSMMHASIWVFVFHWIILVVLVYLMMVPYFAKRPNSALASFFLHFLR